VVQRKVVFLNWYERTFHALGDKDKLLEKLEHIAEDLEEDMVRTGWAGRTVTLKYKLDTFQSEPKLHQLSLRLQ
jgi:hypothetical protein